MKVCSKCGIEKHFSLFGKDNSTKDKLTCWCKECKKQYDKEFYKQSGRTNVLKSRYGISLDDYNDILEQQNGKCAICSAETCDVKNVFVVDHNHKTGKVRGLLCHKCNSSLAGFKDNPGVILKAYQYLINKGYYGQDAS